MKKDDLSKILELKEAYSKKIYDKQFKTSNRKQSRKNIQTNFHQEESTSNSKDKKRTRLNKINIFRQTGGPLPRLQLS